MTRKGIMIADFARLCSTTKRTLHYYDEMDIFKPVFSGDNGYRYYSENQCDLFFTITCLRDIGMSLSDIKAYLDHKDPLALQEILLTQKQKILVEKTRLLRMEQIINTKLDMVEEAISLKCTNQVIIENCVEEYMIVSPYLDTADHDTLLKALCDHIAYCNREGLGAGSPYSAILSTKDLLQGIFDKYAYYAFKAKEPEGTESCLIKPAGQYAVYYLEGDFHQAEDAFRSLISYCHANQLTMGEFLFKEPVLDEVSTISPDRYITKISVQVFPYLSAE